MVERCFFDQAAFLMMMSLVHRQLKSDPMYSVPNRSEATKKKERVHHQNGYPLICVQCQQRITHSRNKTTVQGNHIHTCVNPSGIVYQIGCFSSASGCVPQGSSSDHWSWFQGYYWQVVLCTSCGLHMGWIFTGSKASFFGLILKRLIQLMGE